VIERVLSGVRSGDIAEFHPETLISGAETVAALVTETVLRRGIRTFYVVDAAGRLAGLVTLRELAGVPSAERPTTRAMEVMVPSGSLAVLHPEESAWVAMKRMAERGVNQLPVVVDGRLLGAVTRERLLTVVQAGLTLESRAGR
jgi:CBS domain-containing protein